MKGKKLWFLCLIALCLAAIGLSACGLLQEPASLSGSRKGPSSTAEEKSESEPQPEPEDPDFPVMIGETEILSRPERAVALNPSVAEILCDMGLAAKLSGVGTWENTPAGLEGLPRCGSEVLPDIPAILEAKADLVLTVTPLPETAREQLQQAGIPLVSLQKPDTVEGLPGYYTQLALALLGRESGPAAAEAFCAPLMARYAAVVAAAEELPEHPLGAFAAFLPLTLATGDCLQGRLLTACGIENAAEEYTDWQYPPELLIPFEPQVLVVDTRTLTVEEVNAHPNYKTTPCAVNGRILGIDGSAIENGGIRLFEAAEEMARLAGAQLP